MPAPPFPDTPRGEPGQRFYLTNFAGINRNKCREAIEDEQFFWLENLMPVDAHNLRGMYAEAPTLFNAGGKTIVNVYFYNIAATPFAIMFFSDGTATQVRTDTGATVVVSNVAGTFFSGGSYPPVAAQWNASGILIASEVAANGLWAWDGTTLTNSGTAPTWLTNGATTTWPSGVHGNAIEIYQNRAWITQPPSPGGIGVRQAQTTTSAPANGADYVTADGSVVNPQQDASLRVAFNAIKQAQGFLYLFGDSNVSVISNVQTVGSPPVTTYSNQNLDPQTGCTWGNSAQVLGQSILFANQQGVYALAGGVPEKISYELDRLFAQANFAVTPSAAVAMIFGVKCYILLVSAPDQGSTLRNYLLIWHSVANIWFVASTINTATAQVYPQEFNGVMTAWGCDGKNLYQLFQTPSRNLQKIMQSKLWSGGSDDDGFIIYKKGYRFYYSALDYSALGVTFNATMESEIGTDIVSIPGTTGQVIWVNAAAGVVQWQNGSSQNVNWQVGGLIITGNDVQIYGLLLGFTANIVCSDFTLKRTLLQYAPDQTFLG